jgi:1-acyl-sn-glycerol-3-phosphate acyltransferase
VLICNHACDADPGILIRALPRPVGFLAAPFIAVLGWLSDLILRLLGVGVSDLTPATQLDQITAPQTTRNRELDAAVDRIRERFGKGVLAPASSLTRPSGDLARKREK